MAKCCDKCGKGTNKVHSWKKIKSKLNPTKTYYQKPNLRTVKLENGKRVTLCASCAKKFIRTGKLSK
ncbi:MAG TPA: 50S ribosomal protein L28 [Candidatus Paceibacterota bacterium]|jgi:ribosomal protein L28|nr:50S ribosomal protein L28 [Candidatus Paceibacterota bacterium]